jgi:FkbM family methyltransferase
MQATRLRHLVGHWFIRCIHAVLCARAFPLTRYVPRGWSYLYDIQRHAGARDIGPVLDVGANTGQTAWGLVRYFPSSAIYCFEPVRQTYEILLRDYGTRATCVNMALGSAPGEKAIQLLSDPELNTFSDVRGGAVPVGVEVVTVSTVDRFCAEHGITQIGLLKLDVQGWEMEVLNGAARMLGAGAVRSIYAEVGFRRRDTDMQAFAPLNDHLDRLGYEFCGLYDAYRWGETKSFVGFANALYVLPPNVMQTHRD